MQSETLFVVQPFEKTKRGMVVASEPILALSRRQALSYAQRLAASQVGAVAFSRTADPVTGEWADAVIIGEYGDLPPEVADDLYRR